MHNEPIQANKAKIKVFSGYLSSKDKLEAEVFNWLTQQGDSEHLHSVSFQTLQSDLDEMGKDKICIMIVSSTEESLSE